MTQKQQRRGGRASLAIAAAAALFLTGCGTGSAGPGQNRPQVVVTTNILGDVVSEVLGESADVVVLMKPNADPHSFEISAQEAALMGGADLVVSNGLGLEEGLQQHLERVANAGVEHFIAGEEIEVLEYAPETGAEPAAGSEAAPEGEAADGAEDPHFWTDPARMSEVVLALQERLTEIPAFDAEAVRAGASRYVTKLEALDAEMAEAFGRIPDERRALVTNHHVFGYLAERFDFSVVGAIIPGGTTLASPSAADLDSLATTIREAGVPTIFAESSQPDRLAQVLASEAGVDVSVVELFTESLTAPGEGAEDYLTMMRINTERIATGLA